MASETGDIYHYDFFDQRADRFTRFTLYHLDQQTWRLKTVTYADRRDTTRRRSGAGSTRARVDGAERLAANASRRGGRRTS